MRLEARSVKKAAGFTRMEEEKLGLGERRQKIEAKLFPFQFFSPQRRQMFNLQ